MANMSRLNLQTEQRLFADNGENRRNFRAAPSNLPIEAKFSGVAGRYASEQALRIVFWSSPKGLPPPNNSNIALAIKPLTRKALEFERNQINLSRTALALALGRTKKRGTGIDQGNDSRNIRKILLSIICWIPIIKAAMYLQRRKSRRKRSRYLESVKRYEPAAEFYPQYISGLTYLRIWMKMRNAAKEFEKILNHRGESPLSTLYPLASFRFGKSDTK